MGKRFSAQFFFILILSLNPVSSSHQLTLRMSGQPLMSETGPVKLECQSNKHGFMDFGVFWFRQRKATKSPESILFLSPTSKSTYSDTSDYRHFKASKGTTTFSLEIDPFGEKDQGIYYCMINKNSILYISPGISLYYPAVTTPEPTTTTVSRTRDPELGDPKDCSPTASSSENGFLGIPCDVFIWGPLMGLCCGLLLALTITAILLCKGTRRRHCRCKHVPLKEKPAAQTQRPCRLA
ncbi:T-cell surface glycoprotein CD8 alpha chain [Spea bombifrons]|uniref:T-cell surface glycoprotein CD8 alpha chain n=1 Tax=Spea bombifrons TaxID=233779 RepID=UPI00234B7343|nr:T-cell surface glycoprotein CD8 alpha chain [Spea bombifrons]